MKFKSNVLVYSRANNGYKHQFLGITMSFNWVGAVNRWYSGQCTRLAVARTWDQFLFPDVLKTLNAVFAAFLLSAQYEKRSLEKTPASLLDVFVGKGLDEISPFSSSKQVAGCSSLPISVDQSHERLAN